MTAPESDKTTLELIARSPRVPDDWTDALPAWRDQAYPGLPVVDALILAGVLHSPAARIVELVEAGTIAPGQLPVFITALGGRRLEQVLAQPTQSEPEAKQEEGFDSYGAGEFIPLDGADDVPEAASATAREYDAYDAGSFISFAEEDAAAEDQDAVSVDKKAGYDQYEPGDFITFDDSDA